MNRKLQSKLAGKAATVAEIAQRVDLSASQIAVRAFKIIKGVYCKTINPFKEKGQMALHKEFRLAFTACHKLWKYERKLVA